MNRCQACDRECAPGAAFCAECLQGAKDAIVRQAERRGLVADALRERCPACGLVAVSIRTIGPFGSSAPHVIAECGACLWRILLSAHCACGRPVEWFPGGEPGVFYCMGCLRSYRVGGSFRPNCPACGAPMLWSIPEADGRPRPGLWVCVCGAEKPAAVAW